MAKQKFPIKNNNVSYSNNKIVKSLSVPFTGEKFKFGTGMTAPIWKKGVHAKDFVSYADPGCEVKKLEKKSEMVLFRTDKYLYIGFFFYENKKDLQKPENQSSNIWTGDMAEIHFGDMEPEPWHLQTGIGITGIRFDSTGAYDKWQAKTFITDRGWGAEVRYDLSLFRLTEGGFRFNICRQSLKRNEFSTWSPLQLRFHEVENFGELLFTDYKTALQLKTGRTISGKVSRNAYETARSKEMIPAEKVIHMPFLSMPDTESVKITWETAGKVSSYLVYREKDSKKSEQKAFSGKAHGILAHDTTHSVWLTGLTPGKTYEYKIFTLSPVTEIPVSTGIRRTFRIPEKKLKRFSFYCVTDVHSDVGYLRRALSVPDAGKAEFTILLGDNLSHATGREALYDGIIDPIEQMTTDGIQNKPMVFVRGNHEQLGVYAGEYFRVMGHPSGKSYYSFRYGSVFFLVLDSGNDSREKEDRINSSNKEFRDEERRFIENTVASGDWKNAGFRVVLMHIPPVEADSVLTQKIYDMTEPLRVCSVKPDVMICGHIHEYQRINAGENKFSPETRSKRAQRKPVTRVNPFPVIVHTNTAGLDCRVSEKDMTFTVLEVLDGKEATVIDRIKIKKQ